MRGSPKSLGSRTAEPEAQRLGTTDASTRRLAGSTHERVDPLDGTGYRALALIGGSPLSDVFRAEHVRLDTQVAVKIMRHPMTTAPEAAERLRLESQALSRLCHPNLVRVLDSGLAHGRAFFVMDYLVGRTLAEELAARGRLPPGEAVDVACQALAGLAEAHRDGLVHRDVHPGNLFLCEPTRNAAEGTARTVKVLDFGVVKIVGGYERHGLAPLALPTRGGIALGQPRYCSPEQAAGAPIDARADVYAMGAVLYRMLAGRDPFAHHDSTAAVLRAHCQEQAAPPSHWAGPEIPSAVDQLVLEALSKRPDDRPPTATAFAARLAAAGRGRWHRTIVIQPTSDAADRAVTGVVEPTLDCTEPMATVAMSRAMAATRVSGVSSPTLVLLAVLAAIGGSAGYLLIAPGWRTARAGTEPRAPTSAVPVSEGDAPTLASNGNADEGRDPAGASRPDARPEPSPGPSPNAAVAPGGPGASSTATSTTNARADRGVARSPASSSAGSPRLLPFGEPKF
jgi:hypothetical protein